jgi:hypothetical protein
VHFAHFSQFPTFQLICIRLSNFQPMFCHHQPGNVKIIVPSSHNTLLSMGDRDKNFKFSIMMGYISHTVFFLDTHYPSFFPTDSISITIPSSQ